ncbi:hypothetical protein TNCV_1661421 [Trichonephila clavipes]|nr:hypothetical protein TNCV_1661421 [Trichonephila clavipes]
MMIQISRQKYKWDYTSAMMDIPIRFALNTSCEARKRCLSLKFNESSDSICCAAIYEGGFIQGDGFQQVNKRPHTAAVGSQHTLQSVDILLWLGISPDLFPVEYEWDIIG